MALSACAPEPPSDAPADVAQPAVWVDSAGVLEPGIDPAAVSARDRFIASGPRIAARTRAELMATLGPPDSTHAEAIPNRHVPGQIDSLVTVHYDAVSATLYAVSGGREILSSITIRDNRWLRDDPVRIGAPSDSVRALWGDPPGTDADPNLYACRACVVDQSVRLVVRNGRVSAIRFDHYVD